MAEAKLCAVEGCGNSIICRGFCGAHYLRLRRYGDPLGKKTMRGAPLAFISRVAVPFACDDCLPWPFAKTRKGYSRLYINGRNVSAARYLCELVHGAPPTPGHECAHSCGKGHEGCMNPQHLSWKTPSENQADKLDHGTLNCGERCGTVKLTEESVRQIRSLRGVRSCAELAVEFGVSKSNISAIHQRKSWTHI